MKNLVLFLLFLINLSLFGQKANLMVSYDYHYFDPRAIEKNEKFILLAGKDNSKFYNNQSQWLDSIRCTEKGQQWYNQQGMIMMGELMNKSREEREAIINSSSIGHPVNLYITKNNDTFNVWDMIYYEYRKYSEPIEERDWEINIDSTKNILGYENFMAKTKYHGREWTVWFSPEVPVNAGPWKLLGLPGLIFEAIDETGQHHFTATGIKEVNMEIPPVYEPYEYEKTTRKEFLQLCRYRYDNFQGMSDLHFGGNGPKHSSDKIAFESGKPGFDFLETDYKK